MKLPPLPGGRTLQLSQAEGVIGGTIWPAASALCQYLLLRHQKQKQQRQQEPPVPASAPPPPTAAAAAATDPTTLVSSCLELGSGTGAVGLYVAAALGYHTILTEHRPPVCSVISSVPYSVDGTLETTFSPTTTSYDNDNSNYLFRKSDRLLNLLQANVDANRELFMPDPGHIEYTNNFSEDGIRQQQQQQQQPTQQVPLPRVMELDWTDPDHVPIILKNAASLRAPPGFDLILASDVTYVTELHTPLVSTISQLLLAPAAKTTGNCSSITSTPQPVKSDLDPDPEGRPPGAATAVASFRRPGGGPQPTCVLAHQERLVDWKGRDHQLSHFETVLAKEGLHVSHRVDTTIVSSEGFTKKNHKVSILEIQIQ